jgi:hypothetical protein
MHRLLVHIRNADQYFAERFITGETAARFVRGEQWTPEERAALLAQNRIPYVLNEILPKVRHLMGVYLSTITDVVPVPREPTDEYYVNVVEQLLRWFEQVNNLRAIEYQVFWDMLVRGVAATQIRWGTEDIVRGYPKLERIAPGMLLWDPAALDIQLQDARWMARIIVDTRVGMTELYPAYRDIIEKTPRFPWAQVYRTFIPEFAQLYMNYWRPTRDDEYVGAIEFYERLKIPTWIVWDYVTGNVLSFDEEREAREYAHGLEVGYLESPDLPELLTPTREEMPKLVEVIQQQRTLIRQTLFIGGEPVHEIDTDLPDFPYQVAFAFWDNGKWWGYVEQLMDAQRFYNRVISEWDNMIGRTHKQLMTVVEELLSAGWTAEDVARERSKTGATIPVKDHSAIMVHPQQGGLPDFPALIQLFLQRLEDYAGGRNVLGLQTSAAESGRAVAERAQLGGLGQLPVFENLRLWRKRVSEMALWYMQQLMTPETVVRIINDRGEAEFYRYPEEVLDTLRELQFDMTIESTLQSSTIYEREFQLLSQYFAAVAQAIPPVIAAEYLLELLPIPRKRKESLKQMIEFYVEWEQQKAAQERQQKIVQQAQESAFRRILRQQFRQAMESSNGTATFAG